MMHHRLRLKKKKKKEGQKSLLMIPQCNTVPKIVAGLSRRAGEWVGPRCPERSRRAAETEGKM